MTSQLLHYDVSVGAYMQLDQPREPLVQEALALLIPRPVAEEVTSESPVSSLLLYACPHAPGTIPPPKL